MVEYLGYQEEANQRLFDYGISGLLLNA